MRTYCIEILAGLLTANSAKRDVRFLRGNYTYDGAEVFITYESQKYKITIEPVEETALTLKD